MSLVHSTKLRRRGEQGFIITLVAVFLLFVVGAMAALSIDVVTFYTARSEAQLAADAAALAGARVLANSGVTSDAAASSDGMWTLAKARCESIGAQVGGANQAGGQSIAGQITVTCKPSLQGNPTAKAVVQVTVPAFFAHIWGTRQVTIAATATAEAYNPSGTVSGVTTSTALPVALSCVKPWLVPNINPNPSGPSQIFDVSSGQILDPTLLGMQFVTNTTSLHARCGGGSCPTTSAAWQYYVGDDTSFPPPTVTPPACTLSSNFELSIAGCVQTPIACGSTAAGVTPSSQVNIDFIADTTLDQNAGSAVDCLAHTSNGNGDAISAALVPPSLFQFTAGADDPLVKAGAINSGDTILVSDSLVTVPVYDSTSNPVVSPVTVIGFLQLFVEPAGTTTPSTGIQSEIVNMVGCGNATGQPVYGNGATAVPVRLIASQ